MVAHGDDSEANISSVSYVYAILSSRIALCASGPAVWIPDEVTANCMDCSMPFTLVRRRHHCRKCGKIFCSRCSCHWMSLPQEGYSQPVRVCNSCFLCNVSSVVEGMVHTC